MLVSGVPVNDKKNLFNAIIYSLFYFSIFFIPLPFNKYEYKIFRKLSTVKEEVERAKYSELIICP